MEIIGIIGKMRILIQPTVHKLHTVIYCLQLLHRQSCKRNPFGIKSVKHDTAVVMMFQDV